jgi:hypothetical protein
VIVETASRFEQMSLKLLSMGTSLDSMGRLHERLAAGTPEVPVQLGRYDVVGQLGRGEALGDVDDEMVQAARRIQIRVAAAAYFSTPLLLPILACNLIIA